MEVFRAFGSAWDTFESRLGDRGSIAAICSREAMTASLASTYYPSLSSFTCQETGCPLWSMEGGRGRGGLGPPEPAGAPRAPLRKAAGGAFVPTKRSCEKINNLTQRRQGAKTRKGQLLCFLCAFYDFVPPRGMKCFCSSRDYFTASNRRDVSATHAIRRRRAQTPCPCPRHLTFNPFGFQIDESLDKLGAREPDAGQHNEAQCCQEQER
jgi:hypothetical protein